MCIVCVRRKYVAVYLTPIQTIFQSCFYVLCVLRMKLQSSWLFLHSFLISTVSSLMCQTKISNDLAQVFKDHKRNLDLLAGPSDVLLAVLPSLNIIDSEWLIHVSISSPFGGTLYRCPLMHTQSLHIDPHPPHPPTPLARILRIQWQIIS